MRIIPWKKVEGVLAVVVGVLILVKPNLLGSLVAGYLIAVGLIHLTGR